MQATAGIGDDVSYFHTVKVSVVVGQRRYFFDCYAGFMYALDRIGIGLLGRHGFFELFESVTFQHDAKVVQLLQRTQPVSD